MQTFTIRHDDITIPVSRAGRGRPLVLCPGLNSTQADLHELTELLQHDHDVVTFDLRGHGLTSGSERYSFDTFLTDLTAVFAQLDLPSPPVLVGYSMGADLALHYTAEHPQSVAELVLVDGANPLPEPFITEVGLEEFRGMATDLTSRQDSQQATSGTHQVQLTAQDVLDLNLEIDVVRSKILDQYRKVPHPIRMIMSTNIAGNSNEGRAPRHNQLWRAGIQQLVRERPHIATFWLDSDHRLIFTHATEIAEIIRGGSFSRGTDLTRPSGC